MLGGSHCHILPWYPFKNALLDTILYVKSKKPQKPANSIIWNNSEPY